MPAHGLAFAILVAALLVVDLGLLQRPGRFGSVRSAWLWTGFLALLACAWAVWIGHTTGRKPAIEFATGYLIEGSLSVDNLFVFLILFRALRLDAEQQRRVLMWGVLGAIVLRGVLILAGATLLARFAWIQYAFGALLAFAALRLLLLKPGVAPVRGPVRWIQSCCLRYAGTSRLAFRSLLLVILAIEATDLVFALDSIPAVLAVTRDPWIAFTSNIFAVLGLRSLYFALAALLDQFRLLHYGLSCILAFVAFKMLAVRWVDISALSSLVVILAILGLFAALSKAFPGEGADLTSKV
jgi:tellurite resistance protein TerC